MYIHRTHAGEFIKGKRVQRALAKVADDWAALARAIHSSGGRAVMSGPGASPASAIAVWIG